MVMNNQFFS